MSSRKTKTSSKSTPKAKKDVSKPEDIMKLGDEEVILNEDTLDMLEGMTERLEETTDMAEKVRLHSEISQMTKNIKGLIDGLIKDVDDQKILADPSTIFVDEISPDEHFDVMGEITHLESELDEMDGTDDLKKKAAIYAKLQRKCQVLKNAADEGELIIRKCN